MGKLCPYSHLVFASLTITHCAHIYFCIQFNLMIHKSTGVRPLEINPPQFKRLGKSYVITYQHSVLLCCLYWCEVCIIRGL